MCGEHWSQCRVCAPVEGSSPHVRGALVSSFIKTIQCGIIPACAGSTLGMGNWCRFRWDHPRMYGEHKSMAFCVGTLRGSSPHVRGALVWSCPYCGHSGIIPACAGSTRYSTTGKQGRRDHPRMCGEHGGVNNYNNPTLGSSPHVRGAHAMTGEKTQVYGIIPACAGSTRPNLDCPRLWGGSSPHVRGARQPAAGRVQAGGIIPACAGSTSMNGLMTCPRRDHPRMCGEHHAVSSGPHPAGDHPRMCGEHLSFMAFLMVSAGSSPHVRGARHHLHKIATRHGIIPACAGSTFNASFGALQNRDHPRMCGEHAQGQWAAEVRVGLSPHVRGAHRRQPQLRQRAGIIPACAGSTCWSRSTSRTVRDHPRMCGEHCRTAVSDHRNRGSSPHVRGAHRLG